MPIPRNYKTEGIVIRHSNYGEADRILTIASPGYGKISAIAKGARKVTSKLASGADLLTRTQFVLATGRELHIVTQSSTIERYDNLRQSLWHGTAAYMVAEAIERAMEPDEQQYKLYQLMVEALRRLELDSAAWMSHPVPENRAGPETQGWAALRYFELRLLDILGYKPSFQSCAACERALEPVENSFNAELGGALCPDCSRYGQRKLPLMTLKVLRLVQRMSWSELPVMRLDAHTRHDVEQVMQTILSLHLERNLRSWKYML